MPTLDWIGKQAVVDHHREVPYHLLRCDRKKSIGDPEAENLLVQGDNLLALKALLPYYAGKVKCIYIDPPYNTGNEGWVYNDNVNSAQIKEWLGKTVGKEAEDLSRHDKWLCMMCPRLKLLREFLTVDGAIFISIGADEFGHLRLLCDEIFGPQNLIEMFVWNTEGHTENQERVTSVHEYILAYERTPSGAAFCATVDPNVPEDSKIRRTFAENSITKNGPGNPPSLIELPAGFPCEAEDLELPPFERFDELVTEVQRIGYITRPISAKYDAIYPLRKVRMVVREHKLAKACSVYAGWASARKLKAFIANDCAPLDDDESRLSYYLSKRGVVYYRRENRTCHYVQTVLRNMGTTERNRYELEAMGVHFNYPKPKELIAYLLSLLTKGSDIVMDSFAGSGTTGHATMLLNAHDLQTRRFIAIELERDVAHQVLQPRLTACCDGYVAQSGQRKGRRIDGLGGGFRYCTLGQPLFDAEGQINEPVTFSDLAHHVFFTETGTPLPKRARKDVPLIGTKDGVAYYLLFNGILGDKRASSGNVLTRAILDECELPEGCERRVMYGEANRLHESTLKRERVTFKQLPYEVETS